MKNTKKVDAKTSRERQSAFRQEKRRAGARKVSFYLTGDEKLRLEHFCNGKPLSYAIMEAINDANCYRKHVGIMERIM